jgi:hypothetical protein
VESFFRQLLMLLLPFQLLSQMLCLAQLNTVLTQCGITRVAQGTNLINNEGFTLIEDIGVMSLIVLTVPEFITINKFIHGSEKIFRKEIH